MAALPKWLDQLSVTTLEASASTIVALGSCGTILWVNGAYARFAHDNGAAQLPERFGVGTPYLAGMSDPLRAHFGRAFATAIWRGQPYLQRYECSSPERFREYQLRALPFSRDGLLLEHSLVSDRPHDRVSIEAFEERYRGAEGFFTQCSNCRRFERSDDAHRWDWIPAWVAEPLANTSHGLCPICFEYYYP